MAWTHEQSRASDTQPLAFSNNVKAGSLLIVGFSIDRSGVEPAAPFDSRGNNLILIERTQSLHDQVISWYMAVSNGAGADTVTFDPKTFNGYLLSEFSCNGTPTLDTDGTIRREATGTGTDAFSTSSVTAANAGSLILSFIASDNGTTGNLVAGTGCVLGAQSAYSSSSGDRIALEYRLSGGPGSISLPWSPTVTWDGQVDIGVFYEAASGTSTLLPRHAYGGGCW